MIVIKNKQAIVKMKEAGAHLSEIFVQLHDVIRVGITTQDINDFIEIQLKTLKMVSKMKGYQGYRHVSCISINDEVVHGVPTGKRIIVNGDMITVDVCASLNGYCADMARTFFAGTPSNEMRKLADVAQSSLDQGIAQVNVGNKLGDVSAAIQKEIEQYGFGVVRDFAGHGIGKQMHEEPEVLNYGKSAQGPTLRVGMAFAIEPMITQGHCDVYVDGDGWTVKTVDKSLAAHVEDTVVITNDGPLITTR